MNSFFITRGSGNEGTPSIFVIRLIMGIHTCSWHTVYCLTASVTGTVPDQVSLLSTTSVKHHGTTFTAQS